MKTITFSCETITPMFLSGADGSTPELRPPSIKGALRFWWRAMNGHLSLEKLKEKEDYIFGGSGNRSKVLITKIIHDEIIESYDEFNQVFYTYQGNERRRNGNAFPTNAMYYLGYGVANWVREEGRPRFVRPYIPVGLEFTVNLKVQEGLESEIISSFKAIEQFGGLGSKTRNAYGGFKIKTFHIQTEQNNVDNLDIKKYQDVSLNDYTSFSKKVSLFETKETNHISWEEAFKAVCEAYQYARENIEEWHYYEIRELIALPIVVKDEREMKDNFLERHAKPYFMHITQSSKGYKGEVLFLPYNYIESCETVKKENIIPFRNDYFEAVDGFNKLLSKKMNTIIHNKLSK